MEALKFFTKISKVIFKILVPLAIIAGLGLSGIYLFFKNVNDRIYSESKFDSAKWIDAASYVPGQGYPNLSSCFRGRMYDDLKKNYLKKGMSFEEVKKLLGEPSGKRIYSNYLYLDREWLRSDDRTVEEAWAHISVYLKNTPNRNMLLKILDNQRECLQYNLGSCNMGGTSILIICFDQGNYLKTIFRSNRNDSGQEK
ncbi:hypothetical protein SZ25_00746 [Candidatus Arcanobacter lacustris]|uniref:Uncharacterized protein n=1 Tax=Candidatus Arcanibacter lacustris TaxID=1607817 RepID=A0A0F5MMX3_9RICK|nr:hypothetical protein SZ25_00746 [Candidatus Arcanobacter lacustris]